MSSCVSNSIGRLLSLLIPPESPDLVSPPFFEFHHVRWGPVVASVVPVRHGRPPDRHLPCAAVEVPLAHERRRWHVTHEALPHDPPLVIQSADPVGLHHGPPFFPGVPVP